MIINLDDNFSALPPNRLMTIDSLEIQNQWLDCYFVLYYRLLHQPQMLLMLLLVVTVGRPETFKNKQPNNTFQTQKVLAKYKEYLRENLRKKHLVVSVDSHYVLDLFQNLLNSIHGLILLMFCRYLGE